MVLGLKNDVLAYVARYDLWLAGDKALPGMLCCSSGDPGFRQFVYLGVC